MWLRTLIYFYGRRLRAHPVQELLAGFGIAVGVALVFAVQVANSSITSGSRQIVQSIVGAANLQLRARSAAGFDEHLVERVRALPGVQQAAPVLDLNATVRGPNRHTAVVQLASGNLTLASLDGLAGTLPAESLQAHTVMLPSATAQALGVSPAVGAGISKPLPVVWLQVRGSALPVKVSAVLGRETAGALSDGMAVIAPLRFIQRLASMPGRITRVLVQSKPGEHELARRGLQKLAGSHLTVASATEDVRLLKQATIPNDEATGFFAFVSALVGMLLAFNAMLLSTPERRRTIADLRIQGTRPKDLVALLMFQALCLGLAASLAGVLLGDLLSRGIFHQTPGYLAAAFPLGTQTIVTWKPVLYSLIGGVAATCLAAAPPLFDLRRSHAVDGVYFEDGAPGHAMGRATRIRLFLVAVLLVSISTIALITAGPVVAVGAIVGLALAALLSIPLSFTMGLCVAQALAARAARLNVLLMATRALQATTARSLALAATGAIAVFGSVAAEGAHRDLLNGLYGDYSQYVSTASLWVTNRGDELATNSFPASNLAARIGGLRGVAAVRTYQGGFFDLGGRRVWVIARSRNAPALFPSAQIVHGDARLATARLRAGGWIAVSEQIAREEHVQIGQVLTLPTASGPASYRVAATTSNLGWAAGAIVLNGADYERAWGTSDPTALEVDVRHQAGVEAVKRAVERILAGSGLRVQTSRGRALQADVLAREGLSRLTQIALLLMVAAALAMAAAMGASIWQRRPSLASLRIQSYKPSQLRAILLWESALVLTIGCVAGAVAGLYGHALIDGYLRLVTGFPAPFSTAASQMVETTAAIVGAALIALAIPGYLASRVPPALALQE